MSVACQAKKTFFLQESLYPQAITKEDIKQLIVQISSNHPTQESRNVWNATGETVDCDFLSFYSTLLERKLDNLTKGKDSPYPI
jgi:hypothetical protein